jgi:glycosyltransferase involved in cell wall biosynthesis
MKILVVTNWYPSGRNPIQGVFVQDQVRALAVDHDIRVIAPELLSPATLLRGAIPPAFGLGTDSTGTVVVRPRVVSLIPGYPALAVSGFSSAVRKAYERTMQSWGPPDVIHAHVVLNAGYAAVELGRTLRVPVVLTEHATSGSTWLRTPFRRDLAARVYRRAQAVVAVSPALADRVRHAAGSAVEVVGNVVDASFFETVVVRGEATTRFVFVGALIERKGPDHLIRATASLRRQGVTNFSVRIAGAGPMRLALQRIIDELSLGGYVSLTGPAGRDGVRAALAEADFAVLPSHEETFGVVAAEAMACGVPVIGFRNGGFEFVVVRDGGQLVADGDEVALAATMAQAVSGELCFDAARTRSSALDRFSGEAFRRQMDAVYRTVAR